MPGLTWRGWAVAVLVGAVSALLTCLLVLQVRHWLQDEEQLHQIVALIQAGRIQVAPPVGPPAPAPTPAPTPPAK